MVQRLHDWDWKGAEASIRRAIDLEPGSAVVLSSAGALAHNLGRYEEAENLLRRCIEQDPLSAVGYSALGLVYRSMGRLADAERQYRKTLELTPQRIGTHHILGVVLADQGRDADAMAEANLEPADWARLTSLAYIHFAAGRRAESDEALKQLEATHSVDSAYQIAAIRATRGEGSIALDWLDRAFAERDAGLCNLKSEPTFRSLHGDPRWSVLLKKMGLAE
jgi:serine/threonine-protein kinase